MDEERSILRLAVTPMVLHSIRFLVNSSLFSGCVFSGKELHAVVPSDTNPKPEIGPVPKGTVTIEGE
jgi:hypothetical protein